MVANPERGEVNLTVDGAVYTLKLSMNAAVILQKRAGKTIGTLLSDCNRLDFEAIRSVVWLLLQKHHADEFKTEDQVGNLIDAAGGIAPFADAVSEITKVNTVEGEGKGKARPGGPRPAQTSGTGGRSSSSLAASA